MSDHLYLSPNAKLETEVPFFIVYEGADRGEKVTHDLKGVLTSPKLKNPQEVTLTPQGEGAEENTMRYMGEVSLADPGQYQVTVNGMSRDFEVMKKVDDLSAFAKFGGPLLGGAVLLLLVLGFTILSKKRRKLKTI